MGIKGRKKIVTGYFNFPGGGIEHLEKQKKWKRLKQQQTQHSWVLESRKKHHLALMVKALQGWFSNSSR